MLEAADRLFLVRWCRARRVNWFAATTRQGTPTIMLLAEGFGAPPIRVIGEAGALRLVANDGEILAAASSLQSLLDALDAGIAAPAQAPPRQRVQLSVVA